MTYLNKQTQQHNICLTICTSQTGLHKIEPHFKSAENQYRVYTNTYEPLARLLGYLRHNNLCIDPPLIKTQAAGPGYIATWLTEPEKAEQMISRWNMQEYYKHPTVKIQKSNWNEYIQTQKLEAEASVIGIAHKAIDHYLQHIPKSTKLYRATKWTAHKILGKQYQPIHPSQIPNTLTKYPFLQPFFPHIDPIRHTKRVKTKVKILYLNIDQQLDRLRPDHPWMTRITKIHQPDLLGLSDIGLLDINTLHIPGYQVVTHCRPDPSLAKAIGGCVVLRKQSWHSPIQILLKDTTNNTIWLTYRDSMNTHLLAFTYCRPNNTENKTRNDHYWATLDQNYTTLQQQIHMETGKNAPFLLLGDLNARMGAETGDRSLTRSQNAKHLKTLMTQHKWTLLNKKYTKGIPTFKNAQGRSIIDYGITSHQHHVQNFMVDSSVTYTSHKPIIAQMNPELHNIQTESHKMTLRTRITDNEDTKMRTGQLLTQHNMYLQRYTEQLPAVHNKSRYSQALGNCATVFGLSSLLRALINLYGVKRSNHWQHWTATDARLLHIEAQLQQPKNSNQGKTQELYQQWKNTRKLIQEEQIQGQHRRFEEMTLNQKQNKMKFSLKHRQTIDFADFLEVQGLQQNRDFALKQHYQTVQTLRPAKATGDPSIANKIQMDLNNISKLPYIGHTHSISMVQSALKSTNPNGSAGYDSITQKHLKQLQKPGAAILATLFSTWSSARYVPKWIRTGCIHSLSKLDPEDIPTKPENFRPISLLPIVYKIYERLILWELNDHYKIEQRLHPLQGGFRPGRGVMEQLATLRLLAERSKQTKQPLYIASMDIRQAFPSVWRDGILHKLIHNFGVSLHHAAIIQSLLHSGEYCLKSDRLAVHRFSTTCGVPQGSVISPILYSVFANDLLQELTQQHFAPTLFGTAVSVIAYCDDLLLIAHSPEDLAKLLKVAEHHSHTWRYQFHPDKCKLLAFNEHSLTQTQIAQNTRTFTQLTLDNQPLKISKKKPVRYLGTELVHGQHDNIISDKLTITRFHNALRMRLRLIQQTTAFNYSEIPWQTRIQLTKTFFLPLHEVFAQILPLQAITHNDRQQFEAIRQALYLFGDNYCPASLRLVTGIPGVKRRWIMLKLLFLHKHLNQPRSPLAQWLGTPSQVQQSNILQSYHDVQSEWFPNLTSTQFTQLKHSDLRTQLIHTINERELNTLPTKHPLRILQFCPRTFCPFPLPEYTDLNNMVQLQQTKWNTLRDFYLRNNYCDKWVCNLCCTLCHDTLSESFWTHLAFRCTATRYYCLRYWQSQHPQLLSLYHTHHYTHQLFAQVTLDIIANITLFASQFEWLVNGANITKQTKPLPREKALPHLAFSTKPYKLSLFTAHLYKARATFLHELRRLAETPALLTKLTYQAPITIPQPLQYRHLYSYEHYASHCQYIGDNAILIFTDGSTDSHTRHSGAGIFLQAKNGSFTAKYWEPMGQRPILFAETTAVYRILQLQQKLHLHRYPLHIFTDSETLFQSIHNKQNTTPTYPHMITALQKEITKPIPSIYLSKIPSHENDHNRRNIPGNDAADVLANEGRRHSNSHNTLIPSIQHSKLTWEQNLGCVSQTVLWDYRPP